MSDATTILVLGGLMGFFGGLMTIPITAMFNSWLKREELESTRKLESIAKQRELLLQHKLEMERRGRGKSLDQLSKRLENLEKQLGHE